MLSSARAWDTAPRFHVTVDTSAEPPCVAVFGEIDLATCAAFREALREAITAAASDTIAVDVAQVTIMGSIGVRELVRALETIGHIELRSPEPIVRRTVAAAMLGDDRVRFVD